MWKLSRLSKLLHDEVGTAAVYLSPLVAPLPSAWAIWQATGSITLAVAVEGLGFAAAFVVLRTYAETDSRTLLRFAVVLCAVYFVAVLSILLGAKVLPATAEFRAGDLSAGALVMAWGTLAYPMLTFVGAGVYALVEQLDNMARARREVADAEKEAAQLALDMQRRKAEQDLALAAEREREKGMLRVEKARAQMLAASRNVSHRETPAPSATSGSDGDALSRLETLVRQNPAITLRPLGEQAGVSKDTAARVLRGAGWHKNGNGWERVGA